MHCTRNVTVRAVAKNATTNDFSVPFIARFPTALNSTGAAGPLPMLKIFRRREHGIAPATQLSAEFQMTIDKRQATNDER
jgi:hypothetical protein